MLVEELEIESLNSSEFYLKGNSRKKLLFSLEQLAIRNLRGLCCCQEHAVDTLTHKSTLHVRFKHLVCTVSWSGSLAVCRHNQTCVFVFCS